jgi:hypothetical protein
VAPAGEDGAGEVLGHVAKGLAIVSCHHLGVDGNGVVSCRTLRLGLGQGGAGAVYKRVCIGAVSFIAESNPVFKLVNKLSAKCSQVSHDES